MTTSNATGAITRQFFTFATSVAVVGLTSLLSSQSTAAEIQQQERAAQEAALKDAIALAIQTQVRHEVAALNPLPESPATVSAPVQKASPAPAVASTPTAPALAPAPAPAPEAAPAAPAPAPAPEAAPAAPAPAPAPVDAVTAGS
jgi:hypothetical protein